MRHAKSSAFALAGRLRVPSRAAVVTAGALAAIAWPLCAAAATRYVTADGLDGPACGTAAASACRSITSAINLASPGDTILVGPGLYGDLNRSGVLGDYPGEETGSPGCGCAVSINKAVIVVSSGGAAVTLIDARKAYLLQNVLLITIGGEFGRPGKGFTVTETTHNGYKANDGHGIVLDAINVKIRGNRVINTRDDYESSNESYGILPVNDESALIEGNQVQRFATGIHARGAVRVSRNEVMHNHTGINVDTGTVTGNVATQNEVGFSLAGTGTASGNAAYMNTYAGFKVWPTFTGSFAKNNIVANAVFRGECGIRNEGVAWLRATNNYWGAVDGPGIPPANVLCEAAAVLGTTITSPYATKPFAVKVVKP